MTLLEQEECSLWKMSSNQWRMSFGGMLEDIEIPRKSIGTDRSKMSDVSQISLPNGEEKDSLMEVDNRHTLEENRPLENEFGNQGFLGDGFDDFGQGGLQEDLLNVPGLDEINLDQEEGGMEVVGQNPTTTEDATAPDSNNQQQQDKEVSMDVDVPIIPPNDTIRDDEGFVLEPLDVSVRMRQKRKRRLVVDARKELTGDMIRAQLRDQSDILQPKLIPPPSKKALLWKEFGVSDFLLHNPSVPFLSQDLVLLLVF